MDHRDLVVDADQSRLQAMRHRVADLLRQVHRHDGERPPAERMLVLSMRRSARWAGLKLERLRIAREWTSAAEEFDVVLGALDSHCRDLETWLRRRAG